MSMPTADMGDEPMAGAPPSPGMEPLDQPDAAPAPDALADGGPAAVPPADAGAADGNGAANEWGWSARW
jgi:hypothetical protein